LDAEEKNIRGIVVRSKVWMEMDRQVRSGQVQSGSDVTYRKELTG
jgi:hypothetical protein